MTETTDPFFEPYDRDRIAYGDVPSAPLEAYLHQVDCSGRAIDLGAGAGRDTIALAKAGFEVLAIDLSERGAERIRQRAENAGVGNRVRTRVANGLQCGIDLFLCAKAVDGDSRTLAPECAGDGQPDTRRATGDQCGAGAEKAFGGC